MSNLRLQLDLFDGWDGDEPAANTVMETVHQNGAVQPLPFSAEESA